MVRSLLELFEDDGGGAGLVTGALRKLLKASVLKSIAVEFDGGDGATLLVGEDKPSKSEDPELLSTGTRFDVFGLPETDYREIEMCLCYSLCYSEQSIE